MKNAKIKKRAPGQSPQLKPQTSAVTTRTNFKFELTPKNLSCFIGEKRCSKKTVPKREASRKLNKSSKPKKVVTQVKLQSLRERSLEKKRKDQSPDIVKDSLNCILNEIQNKGIKHQWKQAEQNLGQNVQDTNEQKDQIWSSFSVNKSFQKSYASTIDYQKPIFYHSVDLTKNIIHYDYKQQQYQPFEGDNFDIRLQYIGYDARTTIMIRNIPNKYTINDLSDEIDRYFKTAYDFLYLPCDLNVSFVNMKNQCNVGYGFINFCDTSFLRDFYLEFHKHKWTKFKSQKICVLTYARLQGLQSLIEHFENSKVLNAKEKKYRPIIKKDSKIDDLIKNQQKRQ